MNTYQIVLSCNHNNVIAYVIAISQDRAIELFKNNYAWFLGQYDIIILYENVTDKHGNPLKEKIKIY